jgi:peroxiredoxin
MKKLFILLLVAQMASVRGQTIPTFDLLNVADGKAVAVKSCQGCQGVVVIFTSLKCPYDQHYQDRIKALNEKYKNKISFFLINSNPGTDDDESKMKAANTDWGTNIPYLSDKKQLALKALNATRTPQAFLLKQDGSNLSIAYQGAIDDNPQVRDDTGKNYLDDAIAELISGKSITNPAQRVIGCIIRKN